MSWPRITMIPFPSFMYPDRIRIQRAVYGTVQGSRIPSYPNPPEPEEPASVQSRSVEAVNAETGRTTVVTVHTVRTPTDRSLKHLDRIHWVGKIIVVEGPSTPKGIGDIQYKTECLEKI